MLRRDFVLRSFFLFSKSPRSLDACSLCSNCSGIRLLFPPASFHQNKGDSLVKSLRLSLSLLSFSSSTHTLSPRSRTGLSFVYSPSSRSLPEPYSILHHTRSSKSPNTTSNQSTKMRFSLALISVVSFAGLASAQTGYGRFPCSSESTFFSLLGK